MARDYSQRPLTDDDIADAREAIREQRSEIQAYLADNGVDVSDWGDKSREAVSDADREPADSD